MGKKALFDEEQDAAKNDAPQLQVNEEFAARFEHNKKREELHRLKEKYPEQAARLSARAALKEAEEEADASSSEEEDEGFIDHKTEAQIFETLMKIRKKDKSIYDKEAKFYSSGDEEEEEEEEEGEEKKSKKKKKKENPMFLKDLVYKQAMDRDAGLATDSSDDDDEDGGGGGRRREDGPLVGKTYNEEQEDLKNAFLTAFKDEAEPKEGDDVEFGGVLKSRRKKKKEKHEEDNEEEDNGGGGDDEEEDNDDESRVQQLLDAYFTSGGGEFGEDEKFLRSYILNKGWVEYGDGMNDSDDDDDEDGNRNVDVGYDEEAWAASEKFEANYNFRYEEPGAGQLVTYPRIIEGTVRKEDDRRKRQRADKAAKKAVEEETRRAELKRLKNLKKSEIESRLEEVRTVAGAAAPKAELLDELLAGDFDPEAHDRAMAAAFGADYYGIGGDEDEELEQDETFARELEAMADYDSEDDGEAKQGGFAAMRNRLQEAEAAVAAAEAEEEDDGGDGGAVAAQVHADLKRLLEEYHKLDYEDHVGGIPTRFRYKEVQPETYGLTVEEILLMDDKDLNQIVGLKRVAAPYREEDRRMRPNYGKLNEWRRDQEQQQQYHHRSGGGYHHQGSGGGGGGGGGDRSTPASHHRNSGSFQKSTGDNNNNDKNTGERREKREKPTAKEQRLATFTAPKLKKREREGDGGNNNGGGGGREFDGKAKRVKTEEAQRQWQQQHLAEASGLSRAQRKNMKRGAKRAAKRPAGEEPK